MEWLFKLIPGFTEVYEFAQLKGPGRPDLKLESGKYRVIKGIFREELESDLHSVVRSSPTAVPIEHEAIPAPVGAAPHAMNKVRLFLCHAKEDKAAVRNLYHRLSKDGFQPWLDEEDILPGQDWEHEIRAAVRQTDIILVCLSGRSVAKTGFVQREIQLALDLAGERPEGTIFLIPCRLEECKVPAKLEKLQWVDLFSSGGYSRLISSLTHAGKAKTASSG